MATLVLGAVGAALGGPVGAAVGRLAGRQLDRSFGSSAARRLSDLRLPTAQYGDPIPAVLGRMRVAGVVLWVSKPVPTAVVSKTGSAQSQSISFALAVSCTPVAEVGRIWADGRLIRDGEGQQSVTFTLRLHDGNEDQPSDALIAATEGEPLTPAYRGIAYLVFEDFDLSSFGNRLPLITAELWTGGPPLTAEWVLRNGLELATADGVADNHPLVGAALVGDNVGEALAPFVEATAPLFAFGQDGWSSRTASHHHLIEAELWALQRESAENGLRHAGSKPGEPTRISLRFFDPALDFAAGEKSARLPGPEKLCRIELPAAMEGAVGKAIAFEQLAERRRRSEQFSLHLPVSFAMIAVGDLVSSEDASATKWVVCEKRLSAAGLTLKLSRQPHSVVEQEVESGGVVTQQRLTLRPYSIALIELPAEKVTGLPRVAVIVTGGTSPYQQVPVSLSVADSTTTMLSSPAEGAFGTLLEQLLPAPVELVDGQGSMKVSFEEDPMLTSCDEAALDAGANLMWVGGEFVQFATARPLGEGVYLLSDLLRGLFDSEVDVAHAIGTAAILLEPDRFCAVDLQASSIGSRIHADLLSFDKSPTSASLLVKGLPAKQ